MKKHRLIGSGLVGWSVTLLGCTNLPTVGDAPADPPAAVSRSQKEDNPPAKIDAPKPMLMDNVVPSSEAANAVPVARIRVKVNTLPILDEEVKQACGAALREADALEEPQRSQRKKEIFQSAVDNLVNQELLYQDAMKRLSQNGKTRVLEQVRAAANKDFDRLVQENKKRLQIQSDEAFKAILLRQGMSLDTMRRQAEKAYIAQEYLRSRVLTIVEQTIGHEQILGFYRQHLDQFRNEDSVQWQDIFLDAAKYNSQEELQKTAKEVVRLWRSGRDFEQLAHYNNGDSAFRKGMGEGDKRGAIRPFEVEDLLFRMKDGQVEMVELPTGTHVIRVVKREFAGTMPFDEKTQNTVRDRLRNAIMSRESKQVIEELRFKAQIEFVSVP